MRLAPWIITSCVLLRFSCWLCEGIWKKKRRLAHAVLEEAAVGAQANWMPKKKSFHFEVLALTNPKNELRIRSGRVILYYGLY